MDTKIYDIEVSLQPTIDPVQIYNEYVATDIRLAEALDKSTYIIILWKHDSIDKSGEYKISSNPAIIDIRRGSFMKLLYTYFTDEPNSIVTQYDVKQLMLGKRIMRFELSNNNIIKVYYSLTYALLDSNYFTLCGKNLKINFLKNIDIHELDNCRFDIYEIDYKNKSFSRIHVHNNHTHHNRECCLW